MASGKVHDGFNIVLGAFLSGIFLALGMELIVLVAFNGGWIVATFIFNPDSDLMPKKGAGLLRPFLYPYGLLFKHRGISHSILFGTMTRIIYTLLVLTLIIYILFKMGHIQLSPGNFWQALGHFVLNYDYQILNYRIVTWAALGMFLADFAHIGLDKGSSFLKKVI